MARFIRTKSSFQSIVIAFVSFCSVFQIVWNRLPAINIFPSQHQRQITIYLGNGECRWYPPEYNTPEDVNFHKTLITGFPSGDKRLTYIQMEALTGLTTKDEWAFEYFGNTNEPFIKGNYPHHEGIWGWEKEADQVVLVVRNLRRTLVEYHDILWDIDYAKTYDVALSHENRLYAERPPRDDFLDWRDTYVFDEISWYGWFIDYWMEGGLMRDIFSHRITTPEHWYMLLVPTAYSREDVTYELIVGDVEVEPSYDPHCENDISGGCVPVEVISAELLMQPETGPAENRKIAQVLVNKTGVGDYLIEEDAWECVWEELVIKKKGVKTFIDREGLTERDYNFSEEMLQEMLRELDRLISKYSEPEWTSDHKAQFLVDLFTEHRKIISDELEEVQSGLRKLAHNDFLGPKTREKKMLGSKEANEYW